MKDKRIDIRVSARELEAIDKRAKVAGLTRTSYLVEIGTRGQLGIVHFDSAPLRDANSLLANATGNLNQIARKLNEYGLDGESFRLIINAMALLDHEIRELRTALNETLASKGVMKHDDSIMHAD